MFRFVLTLANSIIGVSILAMPFCFKQCGIVLATLMLLLSGILTKVTCHLLLKSAILARRRNYELLAYQTFGSAGKLAVEVSMIGFLLGTCTAFFVVMGDLAPPIVANLAGIDSTPNLRLIILVGLGLFVALPLALLRNVESLAGICTASIGFYSLVLLHIVIASWPSLVEGSWTSIVNYWRPAGIFQCLPIFCMALSCQPQIFEIYDALSDPSVSTMNDVVKGAINLCSGCYICVGIFGYIAFCATTEVGGNILTSFPHTYVVESIKLGFVLSVAVSFPLVIFPCRTSIHSLVFRKGTVPTEMVSNYIPPDRFNAITVVVILLTLTVGILIPDIEFVLGMVGSTIGSAICVIFPSLIFVKLTSKNTTERLAAQAVFVVGLAIMVLGTYSNLFEANRGPTDRAYVNEAVVDPAAVPHRFGNPPIANFALSDATKIPVVNKSAVALLTTAKVAAAGDAVKQETRKEPVEPKPPKDDGNKKNETKKEEAKTKVEDRAKKKKPEGEAVVVSREEKLEDREKEVQMREDKADKLLEELEKQKDEQKQIIEEQKEVLQQLKDVAEKQQEDGEEEGEEEADVRHGAGQQQQQLVVEPAQGQPVLQQQQPIQQQPVQQQPAQQPVQQQPIQQQQVPVQPQQPMQQQPVQQQPVQQQVPVQQQQQLLQQQPAQQQPAQQQPVQQQPVQQPLLQQQPAQQQPAQQFQAQQQPSQHLQQGPQQIQQQLPPLQQQPLIPNQQQQPQNLPQRPQQQQPQRQYQQQQQPLKQQQPQRPKAQEPAADPLEARFKSAADKIPLMDDGDGAAAAPAAPVKRKAAPSRNYVQSPNSKKQDRGRKDIKGESGEKVPGRDLKGLE